MKIELNFFTILFVFGLLCVLVSPVYKKAPPVLRFHITWLFISVIQRTGQQRKDREGGKLVGYVSKKWLPGNYSPRPSRADWADHRPSAGTVSWFCPQQPLGSRLRQSHTLLAQQATNNNHTLSQTSSWTAGHCLCNTRPLFPAKAAICLRVILSFLHNDSSMCRFSSKSLHLVLASCCRVAVDIQKRKPACDWIDFLFIFLVSLLGIWFVVAPRQRSGEFPLCSVCSWVWPDCQRTSNFICRHWLDYCGGICWQTGTNPPVFCLRHVYNWICHADINRFEY